ncbi:universal stress protein [Mycolicibacterium brumae]|uniref:Universal stress protein n=1 Tax=Mycolicibacterium brumae TaxID=85968 RepID=A0A2G5PG01_9MYCO|nr:universal stress protein [Mycolicibacterium brumae]MCV7194360.1 universal stress protein [Mycolicibacterium brumae]PIB77242.1 universal stress protein [Mycolicibacterium brumae]RWA15489.1 hypothetical protein MBRU_10590 [Mycolicibacterium brumae DSM 44177]UWW10602.1 universal stress protein [Mycolicibacterium brumae]
MTILAAFSARGQSHAPLHLAAEIARTNGEKVLAAAILEANVTVDSDQVEKEYLTALSARTEASLRTAIAGVHGVEITPTVHLATSVPRGISELTAENDVDLVVAGSSSSGLLGRILLGSVTERMVHGADVPVAIAPRGYPASPSSIQRLTVAFGGHADANRVIASAGELALAWNVPLRIVSFTVRPVWRFGYGVESGADDLAIRKWTERTTEKVVEQLAEARKSIPIPDVDVIIGAGGDWPGAVNDVSWQPGDLMVLGSGAAGQFNQVFLGSAAARILRHAPVPVMILPRA